jgi:type IV pilus assembly protein PilQ
MSRKIQAGSRSAIALLLVVALLTSATLLPSRRATAASDDPAMAGLEDMVQEPQDNGDAPATAPGLEPDSVQPAPAAVKASDSSIDLEMDELSRSLGAEVGKAPPKMRAPAEESSGPNQITNLEFKHDDKGSRVIVRSQRKLQYTETKNAGTHQFIYLFENTATPERFQRAYDTTEFASPVALFTLFQLPNARTPTSKLIVQLREDQTPAITDSDRGLILEFNPTKSDDPRLVDNSKRDVLSGDNIYAKGGTYTGDVIQRLEIKNSDVQDVLRLIARTSGYNVVIGEDVTGKIGTLSLSNIPWDQAFTLVLQSKRLGFLREGNVLRIGTTASLRAEREEASAVEKAQEAVEPLKTLLLPISYAKVSDLAPRGKPFLTPRGTIEADVRTNTIIIKDVEKVVTRVQRLLQVLDTQPARVSISAKIVEMRSSVTRNIGINAFSVASDTTGVNGVTLNTGVAGAFTGRISAPDFLNLSSTLSLGEINDTVKTLANPSVSVVANQTGTVTQSLAFFVPNNTIVAGVLTPGFTQVTTQLNMGVTPIVSSDGSIFMTINIVNDIPGAPQGGQPTIASRSIQTQVMVENGDTAVIGGVFQNSSTRQGTGIPWLMNIPVLGYLFSGKTLSDSSSEIFIFLTAKILNADESFKRSL